MALSAACPIAYLLRCAAVTLSFESTARVVCVATDSGFVLPTAVTLRSLAESADQALEVVILHDHVGDELKRRLESSLGAKAPPIHWIDMGDHQVGRTDRMHLPGAANFRLFIDELDVEWPDRVVYLDVDTLVRKSVVPLWSIDLGDKAVAAVRSVNYPCIGTYGAVDHWKRIGLNARLPFFNSGFLVLDMAAWTARGLGAKTRSFMASPNAASPNADQEALNVCLAGQWLELDPQWNQQSPLHDDNRGAPLLYNDEELAAARNDPAIVHFTDRPKPWHVDCTHPWRDEWRSVAAQTAFAPIRLERTSVLEEIRWRIKRAGVALVRGE